MSGNASDFRDEAAAISRAIVDASPRRDPLEASASLCLPVREEGSHATVPSGILIGATVAIIGVGAFPLGALLFNGTKWFQPFSGVAVGLGALMVIFALLWIAPRRLRAQVFDPTRPGRPLFNPNDFERTIVVNIENLDTYSKAKLRCEDRGVMALDRANERILIEGVRCRYVILGKNVVELSPAGAQAVGIAVEIGDTILRLAISDDGPMATFSAAVFQNPGKRLARRIEEALGMLNLA